jgi:hypothetical protein
MPQITITFDCSNQSFNFNPDPLQVPYNANSTIVWKLVGTQVPSGGSVTFPSTGGITFASNWPGTQPTQDANDPSKYSATDNNNSSNTTGDFKYTTNINYSDGTNTISKQYDPDVENESPSTVSRS